MQYFPLPLDFLFSFLYLVLHCEYHYDYHEAAYPFFFILPSLAYPHSFSTYSLWISSFIFNTL
jgi:hypothetical protein